MTLLKTEFLGAGEAEHTIVKSDGGEYTTMDRRYHMFSHTFTPVTSNSLDGFTTQHLRRMQYLRRRLIEDLGTGDKIFVYKSDRGLSDEQIWALYDAIRHYGNKTALLCVRLAGSEKVAGTVERREDALFVGYIDRFSTVDINIAVWVTICRQVQMQWRERDRPSSLAEVS